MEFVTISKNILNKAPKVFMLKDFNKKLKKHSKKDIYKLDKVHLHKLAIESEIILTFHFRNIRTGYICMGNSSIYSHKTPQEVEIAIMKILFSMISPLSGDLANALYGETC